MEKTILVGLVIIFFVGMISQWLAWRFKLPSILILLGSGILVGPVFGLLQPQEIFGETLFPIVSLCVAVILFEGGLSLRFAEIREIRPIIRNLVTIGLAFAWILISVAARLTLSLDWNLSILLGAILTVTGPTVIIPLLRNLRMVTNVGIIARWEGIIVDPIGAILAVLVFEVIAAGQEAQATVIAIKGLVFTVIIGFSLGAAGAYLLIFLMKRYWIPDHLQNPVTLTVVIALFAVSNLLQPESGLITVTLLGIILANQRSVSIKHIVEFKENLRVLFISFLFIILSAQLSVEYLSILTAGSFIFLAVIIVLVRPAMVWVSSLGIGMHWKDRLFLMWLAPRGIVAASVSAIFAFELTETGINNAGLLVPYTFLVIIGSVMVYGITTPLVARYLKLSQPDPQGVLLIGAHRWARMIAGLLKDQGFRTLLIDSNWRNISAARFEGLDAHFGNVLNENIFDDIDLTGIGKLIALTPNDEVNNLAALHFSESFGRVAVYHLPQVDASSREEIISPHLRGRTAFGKTIGYDFLQNAFDQGAEIKATQLTDNYAFASHMKQYEGDVVPLFMVSEGNILSVFTDDQDIKPVSGQILISLINSGIKNPD